jgi:RsiW-degrading membrane proteinase PrsW (M82 family)
MTYYIHTPDKVDEGPFSIGELDRRFEQGLIDENTVLSTPVRPEHFTFQILKSGPSTEEVSPLSESPDQREKKKSHPAKGILSFLWPFNQIQRLGDIDNRGLLSLIGIGLIPIVLFTLFIGMVGRTFVFSLTALYFSVLWAILFYHVFPAPNIRIGTSIYCFLGTGLVSISLLVGFFNLPYVSLPIEWLNSELPALRAVAFFIWVAIPEELCKILMIYVLSKRSEVYLPRTFAYYGMICGLGFGIYEGLDYQLGRNVAFAESEVEYLSLNLLRLTSIPVLHAVWTGIASYLLGFAYLYPRRKWVLTVAALSVPSVLHALFNTFNGTITCLGISLMSVLMLILYLSKHDAFDIFLGREAHMRNTQHSA